MGRSSWSLALAFGYPFLSTHLWALAFGQNADQPLPPAKLRRPAILWRLLRQLRHRPEVHLRKRLVPFQHRLLPDRRLQRSRPGQRHHVRHPDLPGPGRHRADRGDVRVVGGRDRHGRIHGQQQRRGDNVGCDLLRRVGCGDRRYDVGLDGWRVGADADCGCWYGDAGTCGCWCWIGVPVRGRLYDSDTYVHG